MHLNLNASETRLLLCASLALVLGAQSTDPGAARFAPKNYVYLPVLIKLWRPELIIVLGHQNVERGLSLDSGGDVDTLVVQAGTPPGEARRTGNCLALPSGDGNQVGDCFMQFRVADSELHAGVPTSRVRIEVQYLDQGVDSFALEYDAVSGGPYGDGTFKGSARVVKTNSGGYRTTAFTLCDAYFANRDNEADFRLSDNGDGAETIRRVTLTLLPPGPATINVDACGANPWDSVADSDAIQACIDRACSGDMVTFTSGVSQSGYQGYMIDKTVFLVATGPKSGLSFTSTDPNDHALLKATASLKGFVVRLAARSRVYGLGDVDDIAFRYLDIDGGRDVRRCFGPDELEDGVEDNWGSWLPECTEAGDAWCRASALGMDGEIDAADPAQDFRGNPSRWTTGLVVAHVRIANVECGTGLALFAANSSIRYVTVDTAGDHVHGAGCTLTDNDEPSGAWSDGMTISGPGHVIAHNAVYDASDIGIVFFGGKNAIISDNTIRARPGNHGMFGGISVHPWVFGDISGLQVIGNEVINEGDSRCGGIHAGINLGGHMWSGGCVSGAAPSAVGNSALCSANPPQPHGALCDAGEPCQIWGYVPTGRTITLQDNHVTGAHVNYLVGGLDLEGRFIESGNSSETPRLTDWQATRDGCWLGGVLDQWGPLDFAAHDPTLSGWTDQRIHCER